jgi:Domain of unknown function (DUF222)
MFEPAEEGDVRPDDVRSAARARLSSIMVEFPVRRLEDGFRRATRLAPGVYRTAGLPPAVSVGGFAAADRSPGDDRRSADRPRQADEAPTPGPTTAAVLNRLVPGAVSSHDLLDGIAGWEQLISWAQARQVEFVAEFARRRPGPYAPDEPSGRVSEFAADEIAARLRVTRRAAEIKLSLAVDLADRLPGTEAALQAGRIDLGKAKAIAELTANLAVGEALAVVEERVLRRAGEQTVPELRRSLLRAVARVDPAANAKRNHQARAERFLRVQPCRNGMAELTGRMPAEDAMTVFGAPDDPRRSIPAAWTPWWTCAGPGGPARIRRAGRTTVALRRPMARSRLRPTVVEPAAGGGVGRRCGWWWRRAPCSGWMTGRVRWPGSARSTPRRCGGSPPTRTAPGGGW